MKIFLFLYLLSFSFNFLPFEMYQPEEVFKFLNKETFPPEDAQNIKEKLIKVFEEIFMNYPKIHLNQILMKLIMIKLI